MVLTLREEEAMIYNRSMIFVLTVLLCMAAAPAFAAEELFDTETASAHIEQGISFLKARNFDAAIAEFDESVSIYPEAEAYYYLGYAYYMKNRKGDGETRQKALINFDLAYELDPHFSPTRYRVPEPAPQVISEPSTTETPASPQLVTGPSITEEPNSPQPAEPDELQPDESPTDESQPDAPEAPTPEQPEP